MPGARELTRDAKGTAEHTGVANAQPARSSRAATNARTPPAALSSRSCMFAAALLPLWNTSTVRSMTVYLPDNFMALN